MKKFILIALLSISLLAPASSEPVNKSFPTQDGFTIIMPDTWMPIPKNVLNAYTKALEQFAPNMEKQVYDFGFQPASNKNWLTYPYMLIQVKKTGKVPEKELRDLTKFQQQIELGASNASEALGKTISVLNSGDTLYDEAHHIVYSTVNLDVQQAGKVKALISVILTNQGSINLYGYALESEFNQYLAFYMDAAGNVQIQETFRCTAGSDIPWDYLVIGVLIIAGIVFFVRRKRLLKTSGIM